MKINDTLGPIRGRGETRTLEGWTEHPPPLSPALDGHGSGRVSTTNPRLRGRHAPSTLAQVAHAPLRPGVRDALRVTEAKDTVPLLDRSGPGTGPLRP